MDRDLITGKRKRFDMLQAEKIQKGFDNTDEILKSEEQLEFESQIRKGEVDIFSSEDVKDRRYYRKEDVDKFEQKMESLIEKGEKDFLSQEEYDFIVKGRKDVDNLERKALVMKGDNGAKYVPIFVEKESKEEE